MEQRSGSPATHCALHHLAPCFPHSNEPAEFEPLLRRLRASVARTAAGCRGLDDGGALAAGLSAGAFILQYWANAIGEAARGGVLLRAQRTGW